MDALDLVQDWLESRGLKVQKSVWVGDNSTKILHFELGGEYRIVPYWKHPTKVSLRFWERVEDFHTRTGVDLADPRSFDQIADFIDLEWYEAD